MLLAHPGSAINVGNGQCDNCSKTGPMCCVAACVVSGVSTGLAAFRWFLVTRQLFYSPGWPIMERSSQRLQTQVCNISAASRHAKAVQPEPILIVILTWSVACANNTAFSCRGNLPCPGLVPPCKHYCTGRRCWSDHRCRVLWQIQDRVEAKHKAARPSYLVTQGVGSGNKHGLRTPRLLRTVH